jgi:hypothetical protein
LASKYAIHNHLAKLFGLNSSHGQQDACSDHQPVKTFPATGQSRIGAQVQLSLLALFLFVAISPVTGRVLLLVFVAANQAPTDYTRGTTNQGALATAQHGSGYCTGPATNGRAFGFVAPPFFGSGRLGLSA